jgi:uncharacterized membrane protein
MQGENGRGEADGAVSANVDPFAGGATRRYTDPMVERYIDRFEAGLRDLSREERDEVTYEIQSHIAEAVSGGESAVDVLERLGPAERLARSYRAELATKPGGSLLRRATTLGALTLGLSVPAVLVTALLVGIIFGGIIGGAATLAVAIAPPNSDTFNAAGRAATLAVGVLLLVSGVLAMWGLYWYGRFLVGAFGRAVRSQS